MKDEEGITDKYSKILETWGKYIGFLLAVGGLISLIASNEIIAFVFLTFGCLLLEIWLWDIWHQSSYIKKCIIEGKPLPPVIYSEDKRRVAKVAFYMISIIYVAFLMFLAIKFSLPISQSSNPVPAIISTIPSPTLITSTITPKVISTQVSTQSLTSDACRYIKSRIFVGAKVRSENQLVKNLNIRKTPGLSAPIVTSVVNGTEFIVLDGPVCVDGILWWEMTTTNGAIRGWVAEVNSGGTYYVEPQED